MFAPASMPADRVRLLSRAITETMAQSDVQQRFRAALMEPVTSTQAQTSAMLSAYRARWEPIARSAPRE